jgi:pimeloyl-ACP methyl ester carboxylesterase
VSLLGPTSIEKMIPILSKDFRVIAPDLIGFGKSNSNKEDYTLTEAAH